VTDILEVALDSMDALELQLEQQGSRKRIELFKRQIEQLRRGQLVQPLLPLAGRVSTLLLSTKLFVLCLFALLAGRDRREPEHLDDRRTIVLAIRILAEQYRLLSLNNETQRKTVDHLKHVTR
jgi:hypothetical protein